MKSENQIFSEMLNKMAAVSEVKAESIFRINAYKNAAESIEKLPTTLSNLKAQNSLDSIPAIGKNLKSDIEEFLETGVVTHFELAFTSMPEGFFLLLGIPGIGPKTAIKICTHFLIDSVDALKTICETGEISRIDGFKEGTVKKLLRGIAAYENKTDRMRIDIAEEFANSALSQLKQIGGIGRMEVCGSIRRRVQSIGDIDLLVEITGDLTEVIKNIKDSSLFKEVQNSGNKKLTLTLDSGIQVDVRLCNKTDFASHLQYFTGSKQHNILLRSLAQNQSKSVSEWGIEDLTTSNLHTFPTEVEFYNFLNLSFIPPVLRSGFDEINEAKSQKEFNLLSVSDLKGDLHMHSDFRTSAPLDYNVDKLEFSLAKCVELGYEYIGLTDHSPRLSLKSSSDIISELHERKLYITSQAKKFPDLKVLIGLEVDILTTGSLVLSEAELVTLDYAVVSIHSSFNQSKEIITERILHALTYPKVKILAHPTGRMFNERDSMQADWNLIFSECASRNIFVEINSHPARLDLPPELVSMAVNLGCKVVINSDAHSVSGLDVISYGIDVANIARLNENDIINTWSKNKLLKEFDL